MPELPDVVAYVECVRRAAGDSVLRDARIHSPFVLRTFDPPLDALRERTLAGVWRAGKRIVLEFADAGRSPPLYLVIHLMIAGRLRWIPPAARAPAKISLAELRFESGTLVLTEAAKQKRASLHVCGAEGLRAHDPGGVELLDPAATWVVPPLRRAAATAADFAAALQRENHTLKRVLTDPRTFSGVGNAYSDEILHAARLSPILMSQKLSPEEAARLHAAALTTLELWIERLRAEFADHFPGAGEITAFRPDFAVHGRFGRPCPACAAPVQRIRYAKNETNYCAGCQTGGRLLADRSLSRLLREDWPRSLDELPG